MILRFPVFGIAKVRTPIDEKLNDYRHSEFLIFATEDGGRSLLLFERAELPHEYAKRFPRYADYYAAQITDKMELEHLLAEARAAGATHVSFWSPENIRIPAADITDVLVQLDQSAG